MLKQKPRTRPVQIRYVVHKALKEFAASSEKELGEVVEEALTQNPGFRMILEKVQEAQ